MTAVDVLQGFGEWAWQRHHNEWSWYIRPLFLLPLAWFSYGRSGSGIAVTLAALATSMFWFPAPADPDPAVRAFLAFEEEWLTGTWTAAKVVATLLVPVSLTAFCLAFWRRSVGWGLALLNAMAVGKIAWSVAASGDTGQATVIPALVGLLVCNAVIVVVVLRHQRLLGQGGHA